MLRAVASTFFNRSELARPPMVAARPQGSPTSHIVEPLLDEEEALVDAVNTALDAGDTETVRALVKRHATRQAKSAAAVGDYDAVRDAAMSNLPLDDRFMTLLQGTRTMLDVDAAAILLVDEEDNQLWPRASSGFTSPIGVKPVPVNGNMRKVLETGKALVVPDVTAEDEFRANLRADEGIVSLVAVPMKIGKETFGVFLAAHRTRTEFPTRDVQLLQLVANRTLAGIERQKALLAERHGRAEAERVGRFKADLLNMATHDIRTPMSALAIQMEILGQATSEQQRKKSLAVMKRSVKRMSALLDDFLDMARVESGRLALAPTQFPVCPMVEEVLESFSEMANKQGVQFKSHLPKMVEAYGDSRRILQVMTNLVSNAIRYSPDGGTIVVTAANHGGEAEIQVRDEGLGLTEAQLGQLFAPFAQVQGDEKQGTGLGLYLSKAIVDAHGGTLELTSAGQGKGTTATVRLPASAARRR